MNLQSIVLYCARAGIFAAAICAVYAIGCLLCGKRICLKRIAGVFYVAALVQITVLRGGVDWDRVLGETRALPQIIPFKTTYKLLHGSAWNFVYNTLGNLLWFVPLGFLLRGGRPMRALGLGALLSFGIELSQFLLLTGAPDVDDVIINALGSLLGFCLYKWLWQKRKHGH